MHKTLVGILWVQMIIVAVLLGTSVGLYDDLKKRTDELSVANQKIAEIQSRDVVNEQCMSWLFGSNLLKTRERICRNVK